MQNDELEEQTTEDMQTEVQQEYVENQGQLPEDGSFPEKELPVETPRSTTAVLPVWRRKPVIISVIFFALVIVLIALILGLNSSNLGTDNSTVNTNSQSGKSSSQNNPSLNITTPSNGDSTTLNTILISGTTDKGVKISINGTSVNNNNGSFSFQQILIMGQNIINVIATNANGDQTAHSITISRIDPNAVAPSNTTSPTPVNGQGKITLSQATATTGIGLSWTVSGLTIDHGFRLIWNQSTSAPAYPGDSYYPITDGTLRTYNLNLQDGKNYNFRICQYNGDAACLVYSNEITITAPPTVSISITNITADHLVNFSITGTAPDGVNIVWAKDADPANGSGHAHYASGFITGVQSYTVNEFDGSGNYNVRICAFHQDAGQCWPNTYSNQQSFTYTVITATPIPSPTHTPSPTPTPTATATVTPD